MLVGHTKFVPDRYFGLIKKRFRRSSVDTIVDIARVVHESTTTTQNKARELTGVRKVNFYQWTVFLQQFFKVIPNILKYNRFLFDAAKPGVVSLREATTSEDTILNILKVDHQAILDSGMPELTQVKGLDPQRQWYLYEQIRPFCKSALSADYTCPKPSCPKPGGQCSKAQPHAPSSLPSVSKAPQPTGSTNKPGKRNVHNVTNQDIRNEHARVQILPKLGFNQAFCVSLTLTASCLLHYISSVHLIYLISRGNRTPGSR